MHISVQTSSYNYNFQVFFVGDISILGCYEPTKIHGVTTQETTTLKAFIK